MPVSYSHRWVVPISREATWKHFLDAFHDSKQIRSWPHRRLSIRSSGSGRGDLLHAQSHFIVTYKIGPLQVEVPCQIRELSSCSRLVYETEEDFPLQVRSEILFEDVPAGTLCEWRGTYVPKDLRGWGLAITLKPVFERFFLGGVKQSLKKLGKPVRAKGQRLE
jgi:hypothetical protein